MVAVPLMSFLSVLCCVNMMASAGHNLTKLAEWAYLCTTKPFSRYFQQDLRELALIKCFVLLVLLAFGY